MLGRCALVLGLAFVAPDIVTAMLDGKISPDVSRAVRSHLLSDWLEQRRLVGLTETERCDREALGPSRPPPELENECVSLILRPKAPKGRT